MMKLRKNLLVGSMAALLALGLTACPEDEAADDTGTDTEEPAGDTGEDTFDLEGDS